MPETDNKTEQTEETEIEEPTPSLKVSFPWLMFFAAVFFDLIGLIPVVNFFSETLALMAFGFWQKIYAPKTNPLLTALVTLIADGLFLGLLPRNIATVVYAFIKKRAASLMKNKTPAAEIQESPA